jgi:hypothetical protein
VVSNYYCAIAISHWNDSGNFDTGVRIVDVSGDGLPDFLKCDTTGDCRSWTNMTSKPLLKSIITGTGTTTWLNNTHTCVKITRVIPMRNCYWWFPVIIELPT